MQDGWSNPKTGLRARVKFIDGKWEFFVDSVSQDREIFSKRFNSRTKALSFAKSYRRKH